MHTKDDLSYGVIPFIKNEEGKWETLVIHQFSSMRGDSYWIFPKGHPEEGESPEATARRELAEETGLTDIKLDTSRTFTQRYTFVHEGARINKSVTYYVGRSKTREVTLHPTELKEARWCSLAEARERLTHEGTKEMFDEVVKHLNASL